MRREEITSPNDAMHYYPEIISNEILLLGENESAIYEEKGKILLFSLSLEETFSKYGSLENLWSLIESELLYEKNTMAAMLLQEGDSPKVNVILKFPRITSTVSVSNRLMNYKLNKNGDIVFNHHNIKPIHSPNLYEAYLYYRHTISVNNKKRYDTILVHISPNMAKYLFNYEQIMTYTQYKNY